MHKLGLGIVAAAATLSIAAFAQSANSPSQFCMDNFPEVPHDLCVACADAVQNPNVEPSAVCQCKDIQYFDTDYFNSMFSNLGQCVSYVNQNGPII